MIARLLPIAALCALLLGTTGPDPAAAFTTAEEDDIRALVHDYLVKHPEVLLEAADALEAKRNAETAANQRTAIAEVAPALFSSPKGTVIGNPDGDVTVVEFFDYNCGYCKRALPDMEALTQSDSKLRFLLKENPLLGPDSVAASHVSLAFRQLAPEKYADFHKRLLAGKGLTGEERAIALAEELGVPEANIRTAMQGPEVQAVIDEGVKLADSLKINGTPSYVILDEVVSGAIGKDGLKEKIDNVRRCASTTC